MPDETPDVNTAADSSTAAPETVQPTSPAVQGDDRPVQNVVAEFNRKYTRLQDQLNTVMQMLSQQHPQTPAAAPRGAATDEELWALAQQGDRVAFEQYQERIADRRARALWQERDQATLVDQQLTALAQRYPVFNDTTHPLTQTVQTAYQIMVSRGYPATKATLLDAMKTAIADRPDLVAELHRGATNVQDATRVSATRRAQAGQTGVATRDVPASASGSTPRVSAEQAALAARMGLKDPAKAIQHFKERQARGVSNLGMVANVITEEL